MDNVAKVVNTLVPVKKKKGVYGLAELAAFVDKNPDVTSKDISLLKSWSSTLLGVKNTVKKDVDKVIETLKAQIQAKKAVITAQEAQIAQANSMILDAKGDITSADSQIASVKKIADLFGA